MATEAARRSKRKYRKTAKGKQTEKRYCQSEKGRAAMKIKNGKRCRFRQSIARRIPKALHGIAKSARTVELVGCSIESFRMYLESLWEPGMSWENYGNHIGQWSIDHIIPCSLFDLSREDHQRYCFHFSNMQPMWHSENCSKQNNIVEDRQMGLPI